MEFTREGCKPVLRLANIEAHSGDPNAWGAVEDLIERHLGARLPWRRRCDKDAAAQRRADSIAGYTSYLKAGRGVPQNEGRR